MPVSSIDRSAKTDGPAQRSSTWLCACDARSIAKEVFLWGMHPVAIYHLRYNHVQNENSPVYVGAGRLRWERLPKRFTGARATASATALHGLGFYDLSASPVVITTPDINDRYWSIQVHDNYARWWHMLGSQFDRPGPVKRLLIGPNWSGAYPAGFASAEIVRSPSDFAGVLARVALMDDSPAELSSVYAIQDHITVLSLDQWMAAGRRSVKAEAVRAKKARYPTYPRMGNVLEVGELKGVEFLRWVSLVLNDPSFTKQNDGRRESAAFKRFELLGLKAGQPFTSRSLTRRQKAAVESGIEDGRKDVLDSAVNRHRIDMNGWSLATDREYSDTDWLQRAGYGLVSILGPEPSRSHTAALSASDSEGRPIAGEHKYTITFDLTDLPPVTEFWELSLYDSDGCFYDNALNRYSISSYMLKQQKLHTANGKLVVYVQHAEPVEPDQRRNWLPAPEQTFHFVSHFYGPHGALIDGSYNMPGVVRST